MGVPQFQQTAVLSGPITVAPQSFTSLGTSTAGTALAAGAAILPSFTAPDTGTIVFWGALAATNSVLQYTVNGGPAQALNGASGAIVAGQAFAFAIPVLAGDVVVFSAVTATTSGGIQAAFSQKQ